MLTLILIIVLLRWVLIFLNHFLMANIFFQQPCLSSLGTLSSVSLLWLLSNLPVLCGCYGCQDTRLGNHTTTIFNRPGVAGALLQSLPPFIHSLINSVILYSRSRSRSRLHQSTDEASSSPVRPRKKSHGKGTNIITNINTRTSRLLDQLGPEGRVGEKVGHGFDLWSCFFFSFSVSSCFLQFLTVFPPFHPIYSSN